MTKRDPVNPTDDAARALAAALLNDARFGALAVTLPEFDRQGSGFWQCAERIGVQHIRHGRCGRYVPCHAAGRDRSCNPRLPGLPRRPAFVTKRDPVNPTDDAARALAAALLNDARFGALAVTLPDSRPYLARVAMLWGDGALITLISTLSTHTKALHTNPVCAALIGEPGLKGDPLTHPRMTLICEAAEVDKKPLKDGWLAAIPKARLYYDFSDFLMFKLTPTEAHLNGGFGKAYRLMPNDLIRR